MIIENLHIECFGNLCNLDIELSSGINVIEGNNESGKSTLAYFIKFMFYGLDSRSQYGKPSERERFISWNNGSCSGTVSFSSNEKKYRIERRLILDKSNDNSVKNTYRETMRVTDLTDFTEVMKNSKIEPGVYFFGVDSNVFVNTAFVGQGDGKIGFDNKLSESIENILFSADENTDIQKALRKLDASRVALMHKNGKGGYIYELETKCEQLTDKLNAAQTVSAEIIAKECALESAKQNLASSNEKAAGLRDGIKYFEAKTLLSLFERKRELEAKSVSEFDTCFPPFPSDEFESRISELCRNCSDADRMLSEASEHLAQSTDMANKSTLEKKTDNYSKLSSKKAKIDELAKKGRSLKASAIVFLVIAVLIGFSSFLLIYFEFPADIGKSILPAICFPLTISSLCVFFAMRYSKKIKKILANCGIQSMDALSHEVEAAKKSACSAAPSTDMLDDAREQLRWAKNKQCSAYEKLKLEYEKWQPAADNTPEQLLESVSKAANEFAVKNAAHQKNTELINVISEQLAYHDENTIRSYIDSSTSVCRFDITLDNLNEKKRELDFTEKSAKALEIRVHELEKKLAALYPIADDPARISEKISLARNFITKYRQKYSAYLLAMEKINEAGESMRSSISPRLAAKAGDIMSKATTQKYGSLGVSPNFELNFDINGYTRNIGYMSEGTKDIAYLSLRLAMALTLFRQTPPPVIFDESFAMLDNNRLKKMLEVILSTTQENNGKLQFIIMTSHSRESETLARLGNFRALKL